MLEERWWVTCRVMVLPSQLLAFLADTSVDYVIGWRTRDGVLQYQDGIYPLRYFLGFPPLPSYVDFLLSAEYWVRLLELPAHPAVY